MDTSTNTLTPKPPSLIPSLLAGLETTANNLHLLILPVIVDLILWLAPRLSLKNLLTPMVESSVQQLMQASASNDMLQVAAQVRETWTQTLSSMNLLSLISTFPVGISSLLATDVPSDSTPFGSRIVWEVASANDAWTIWLVLILVGFLAGSYYFSSIARHTLKTQAPFSIGALGNQALQSIILAVLLFGVLLGIAIPVIVLTGLLAALSPGLISAALFVAGLAIIWILMPLVLSPHGIFTFRQNAFDSIRTSALVANGNRAGIGMFVLSLLVLEQGLRILWSSPDSASWLFLVGILGHAFISTALIAASFSYYRDGFRWWQELVHRSGSDAPPLKS